MDNGTATLTLEQLESLLLNGPECESHWRCNVQRRRSQPDVKGSECPACGSCIIEGPIGGRWLWIPCGEHTPDCWLAAAIKEAKRVEKPHEARLVTAEVTAEVERACGLFAPIHGPHEALAVIMEEFEEYKAEVFRFNLAKGHDTRAQQRAELIQLAAMAIRAVLDTLSPLPDSEEAK